MPCLRCWPARFAEAAIRLLLKGLMKSLDFEVRGLGCRGFQVQGLGLKVLGNNLRIRWVYKANSGNTLRESRPFIFSSRHSSTSARTGCWGL